MSDGPEAGVAHRRRRQRVRRADLPPILAVASAVPAASSAMRDPPRATLNARRRTRSTCVKRLNASQGRNRRRCGREGGFCFRLGACGSGASMA